MKQDPIGFEVLGEIRRAVCTGKEVDPYRSVDQDHWAPFRAGSRRREAASTSGTLPRSAANRRRAASSTSAFSPSRTATDLVAAPVTRTASSGDRGRFRASFSCIERRTNPMQGQRRRGHRPKRFWRPWNAFNGGTRGAGRVPGRRRVAPRGRAERRPRLSICKRIMEEHGGRIEAANRSGRGRSSQSYCRAGDERRHRHAPPPGFEPPGAIGTPSGITRYCNGSCTETTPRSLALRLQGAHRTSRGRTQPPVQCRGQQMNVDPADPRPLSWRAKISSNTSSSDQWLGSRFRSAITDFRRGPRPPKTSSPRTQG
jgi:hypothetical protein